MTASAPRNRLEQAGIALPQVIFGTSALGNLYQAIDHDTKRAIVHGCVQAHAGRPAFDSAGKYGAGLALEALARCLRELGIAPSAATISNKLGWRRVPLTGSEPTFEPGVWMGLGHDATQAISGDGIAACFEQGCELLGDYRPRMVSVHDPDEYLAAARDANDRAKRWQDVLAAYRTLFDLRDRGQVAAVGVGAKDWRVIRDLAAEVDLDWVMLACSLTIYSHPPELLTFVAALHQRGIAIINSAVFHAGFLTGGTYFDYRRPDPVQDASLFAWRASYLDACRDFALDPAVPCVRYGLDIPGVVAVALNTSKPDRALANVRLATTAVPAAFWQRLDALNRSESRCPSP